MEGHLARGSWARQGRGVRGMEAGDEHVEGTLAHPEDTESHAHGNVKLRNVDWDQRLSALFFPKRARSMIERNVCRDYKRLKEHLAIRAAVVA